MGHNNLPEDTNLTNIISKLQDRIERLERATRVIDGVLDGRTIIGSLSTAVDGLHWELDSTRANELRGYTGDAAEVSPAQLIVTNALGFARLDLIAADMGQGPTERALVRVATSGTGPTAKTSVEIDAPTGNVGFLSWNRNTQISTLISVPVYASNAAAITGGLASGALYRNGADPDHLCIVH